MRKSEKQIQQSRTHRKLRGVMVSAILLAISVAVTAGVTVGWYALRRETQAAAVVLKSEGQMVSVDGFTLFTCEDQGYGLSEDKTRITLKSYDSVFGKNSETPVYILIPVRGEAVQQSGYTLQFKFDCGSDLLVDETNKIKPLFSNVAQLRYVVVNDPSVLTSYEAARGRFYADNGSVQSGVSAPVCFADFTLDSNSHAVLSHRKDRSITLSAPVDSTSSVKYVLFELDYNFKLVTGFVDNYASDIAGRLDQSQELEFNQATQETILITVSANKTSAD